MNRYRGVISLSSILLLILACSLPSNAPATPDFPATITALALSPQVVQASPTSHINVVAAGDTLTPTITLTPTPAIPMVSVSVDTNCRTGPGKNYDYLTGLLVGEKAEVVGKYTASTPVYWIIRKGGVTCWLWGQYATVEGNTANLPEMIPPPSPTPSPTSTFTPTATSTNPPPPAAAGDLVLQEFFQSTGAEIVLRVANNPTGALSGNFQYQVYANGALVRTGTCSIPTGSAACWTGYIVSGSQSIRAVIDSNGAIAEPNEGNNEITLNCNGASKFCGP